MSEFMKKHRYKVIGAAVVVVLLVGAWAWGGSYSAPQTYTRVTPPPNAADMSNKSPDQVKTDDIAENAESPEKTATPTETEKTTGNQSPGLNPATTPIPTSSSTPTSTPTSSPTATPPPENTNSAGPTQVIDPNTGKDQYKTDPAPEGKPLPVEPQDVNISSTSGTCTLSVRCDTILNNIDNLDSEKLELVPDNGVIFPATTVTFYEGESVFNVLQRELRRAGIHMEFVNTPIYNSAYIEGINNLYEFDCGNLSGWMYKVNGWFPNYGCSRYQIKQGDVIEWEYTCDLGRDVGGYNAIG